MHVMGFQQGGQRFRVVRSEAGVNIVNTKPELIAQHAGSADVRRDHRLFNDAVGNAARLGHDIQHFTFFTEDEAIVRAVFKDQRVDFTPLAAQLAHAL